MSLRIPAEFDREQLLSVRGLPNLVLQRRAFLYRNLFQPFASTLEIGALNTPTIRPGECESHFMDWFHTDELRARHADNPKIDPADLVDVDYVVKSRDFASGIAEPVDLLMANHVLEHVPDPIHWLNQAARCTRDDGRLFLSVPDRRYTFDYFRRENDAIDMLIANQEKRLVASADDVARHLYYFTQITHLEIWESGPPLSFRPRMSFESALEQASKSSSVYTDVHCWVFTTESFIRTFDALSASRHVAWEIEKFEPVQPGQNEMRMLLRKAVSAIQIHPT
jgi:SAM-dependent methyltransferase